MKARLILSLLSMVTIFVAGCMVGPKYVKPNTPLAPEFKEQPPESFKESDANALLSREYGKRFEMPSHV